MQTFSEAQQKLIFLDKQMFFSYSFTLYDLKATSINVQCSLIWELILNESELDHNATEPTKDI